MDGVPHVNGNVMVMGTVYVFLSCVRKRTQYPSLMVMAVMGTRMGDSEGDDDGACSVSEIGRNMKRRGTGWRGGTGRRGKRREKEWNGKRRKEKGCKR